MFHSKDRELTTNLGSPFVQQIFKSGVKIGQIWLVIKPGGTLC